MNDLAVATALATSPTTAFTELRARPGQFDGAQAIAKALLDLREKAGIVECRDGPALALLLRPRDAGAIALQRQDRKRARRQKVLDRTRAVRLLVANRGDNAHLRILPADNADPSSLAQTRRTPVCCHQQRRAQAATVGKGHHNPMLAGGKVHGGGATHQGERGPLHSRCTNGSRQAFVFENIGGGLSAFDRVVIGHEDGTKCIVERGIGDVDSRHRFCMVGERRPDAQRRQQVLRACRHG
jgi:hypothetical protein